MAVVLCPRNGDNDDLEVGLESMEVALDLRSRKYLKDTHDDDGIKEYNLI